MASCAWRLAGCTSKSGQIGKAEAHFAVVAVDVSMPEPTKALNAAFVASVRGDWVTAGQGLAQACRGGRCELCRAFHHLSSHLFWHIADGGKNEIAHVLWASLHMGGAPAPWVHAHTHASDATHCRPHSPVL